MGVALTTEFFTVAYPRAVEGQEESARRRGTWRKGKRQERGEPRRWRSFVIHRVAIALARRRTGFEHVRQESHEARKLIWQLQLHRFLLFAREPSSSSS